jgi:hypothetical protein
MGIAQKYLSRTRGRVYALFVDFAKAFDSTRHELLLLSVLNHEVHGKVLTVIQSMYGQLQSCVQCTNKQRLDRIF